MVYPDNPKSLYLCPAKKTGYTVFQPYVNFICTLDLEVLNYMLCLPFCVMNWIQYMSIYFAFHSVLWIEFSTCQSTNLKKRWLNSFCNYYHIQFVCNHSTALVVIFSCCNLSFCHIFGISKILSLTMPLIKKKNLRIPYEVYFRFTDFIWGYLPRSISDLQILYEDTFRGLFQIYRFYIRISSKVHFIFTDFDSP
jgi:hypothetical protein